MRKRLFPKRDSPLDIPESPPESYELEQTLGVLSKEVDELVDYAIRRVDLAAQAIEGTPVGNIYLLAYTRFLEERTPRNELYLACVETVCLKYLEDPDDFTVDSIRPAVAELLAEDARFQHPIGHKAPDEDRLIAAGVATELVEEEFRRIGAAQS